MKAKNTLNNNSHGEDAATIAGATEGLSLPKADELSDSQHETLAKNYMLVCLIKAGTPIREAIVRAGLTITESSARKLMKRYEQHKMRGIIDQRSGNGRKQILLTSQLKKRVLAVWFARPAAGARAIWRQIVKECQERDVQAPGYDTIKKYLQSQPGAFKLFRQGRYGVHEWERSFCPVVRFDLTTYSNQRWQLDNARLDIWVRVRQGDRWVPAQVHICASMCPHSRSIPGFVLSARVPDSWTTALMLMSAIAPKENPDWKNKGLPLIVQPDRGKTFLAHAVISSLAYLGVAIDPDPPYYPNRKGKLERWFLTLDRGCLRILPGHMDAIGKRRESAERHVHLLLTVPQLRKEIERWVVTDYHQRVHSETRRKPTELWEETVRLRLPESEEALHLMLLKSDKERRVYNTGIRFNFGDSGAGEVGTYWSPELADRIGERVRLRYNPEDNQSILVYSAATNEYLCEAWLMGDDDSRYTIGDIKRARNQLRRGLRERINEYRSEIEREDRQLKRQEEWDNARAVAAEQEESEMASSNADADGQLIGGMLELFRCQDGSDSEEV